MTGLSSAFALSLDTQYDDALDRLERALDHAEMEVEICVVGGAVFPIPFVADATLRRPDQFFASLSHFRRLAQSAGREGPGLGWLRNLVPRGPGTGEPWIDRGSIRMFVAPAEYVLAMRCMGLKSETADGAKEAVSDLRFLLRALGVRSGAEAKQLLAPYATPSQLPVDMDELLEHLVA